MDFTALRTQVIELLQREQRLSYRALKRQFALDDEDLEALKDELIYAKQLAVDEDGRVLVWIGGTSIAPPTVSPVPLPATSDVSPTQGEVSPALSPAPDAERRQLTVMFCDLVDSTALSGRLDPEDLRDVLRAYQQVCSAVITRFDGHIAQLLGDGLLVYFGYPQAHEDDAQRAVYAGLGILDAMKALNTSLKRAKDLHLAIRLGIHTGLVVIGEMGGSGRQEQLALGETPNIAARIEGIAASNTVVISHATYRLVQDYFECQTLGEQHLRGVAEPVTLYRVLHHSGVQSRLDVASTRGLTPLVGRESEVALLVERWQQARDGQGQVVLLSGEAGIGKSRLVQVLKDHVASEPHTRWECRSLPYYQNTALYPIIDLLQRTLRWQQDDPPEEQLATLERQLRQYQLPVEESIPLFAPLFSLQVPEDRYPPLNLSLQRQRQKTLESLVAMLLALAEREPVLFILEDLHWTDPTTREFLSLLVEHVPAAALYTVLTCRPHFQPAWHHRSYLTEITVNRLSRTQIERVAEHVAGGKHLPEAVRQQIVEKTDGVPLFVEEMAKAVLEAGVLKEINGHYALTGAISALSIPATLHDSLMARLDRLVTAKAVAQYGAVIGRQFSYALLHAVSHLDAATLRRDLGRLVEAELLYQRGLPPGATYTFKHALIQDTAYASLLRSTRQGYHRRIAEVLQAQFPALAATQPELLARHYTEAGLHAEAIGYWHQAGAQAIQRSAHPEAVSHLRNGLALLDMLPDASARLQHELLLLIALGPPLMAIQGYGAPEVGAVYTRAHQVCQQVGETPQLFLILRGLWQFSILRTELRTARELGAQLLNLAQSRQDSVLLLEAHRALGEPLFWLGEFSAARMHFAQEMAHYDPQQHRSHTVLHGLDPGVAYLSFAAWTLWCLGYPDQALQRIQAALRLTHTLSHPPSRAFALIFAAYLHQHRREAQLTREQAEVLIALATEQGFAFWVVQGTIMRGWALATQGRGEEGIAQMRQGLTAWHASGHELERPYFLAMLARASGNVGQAEAGLELLREALTLMAHTEERWDEAELYRLKGELLLQQSMENQVEAEACFHQALSIAQSQSAKSFELRAATSLATLWQSQGKRQEAYDLLAPVYGWFTEGFDTADLQDAKALLDVRSERR
jgi:class 3 adenylate cyclase/predicted ATPase